MLRIHNFPRGARGIRAAWVCEELGLTYEAVAVTFPPGDVYRTLNPLGTVPFLQDGAVAINESVAMMLYLAGRYGAGLLLPLPDDPAHADVLRWSVFGEASLGGSLNPLLAARYGAPQEMKRNWSVLRLEERVGQYLAYVESHLGDRPFLVGEALTLADNSVVTALQTWEGGLGGRLSAALSAWRDRHVARPTYQRARNAWS